MNPMQVAQNRTARLVREANTPVYTTSTPKREHIIAVEVENGHGGRYWTHMMEFEVDIFIDSIHPSESLSDIDHACGCWCQPC